jgi:hypothetical protein
MPQTQEKYGTVWKLNTSEENAQVLIEMEAIKRGGRWTIKGKDCGEGLLFHYLELRKYVWPERYRHRWTDLIYKEIIQNDGTILMGAASTQKTSHASEWCLVDYWCFPFNTMVLVSTTNLDKLDSAVFGEIKMLFEAGRQRFPFLAGNMVDYRRMIVTDTVGDGEVRDVRRGIIGKPCFDGKKFVGLGTYAGIKQERMRWLADELQHMSATFFDSIPHMQSNSGVASATIKPPPLAGLKVIGSGNPNHDPETQLGISAEPKEGWSSMPEPDKTTCWDTNKLGFRCVNLVGTDSPNFDVKPGEPEPFYRLIGPKYEQRMANDLGKDSPDYYRLVKGVMRIGLASCRVITRELCKQHKALEKAIWNDGKRKRIHACDPAYGGGDRCISGFGEFGKDQNGREIFRVSIPKIIKIDLKRVDAQGVPVAPEDQIAEDIQKDLAAAGVDPADSFYDSFGKGTMGFHFAQKFGNRCPEPVDSGGRCTTRPVGSDVYVEELDQTGKVKKRRLKRCDEEYSKFVTEMWFTVRVCIQAEQLRELPDDVMREGTMREYYDVEGNKKEVEPKKDMRERLGKSPDLFDWLAILIEGARRRGFKISKLQDSEDDEPKGKSYLDEIAERQHKLLKKKQLNYRV